ncbi:MAG: helix-hairpin-helix domain-containing protein [Burkholderiaceae bacterium]|nr:helix-hairpin-helix domain-containing protein [Burkholderiaceae bacterium]
MFKKLLAIIAFLFYAATAFAANVDANTASSADLDALKGIGPAIAGRIIDARQQGGAFKDWNDFISRVKGIGNKNAAKFSAEGLTIGGAAYQGTSTTASQKSAKSTKSSAQTSNAVTAPAAEPASPASASTAKKHGGKHSKKANAKAAAASAAQ